MDPAQLERKVNEWLFGKASQSGNVGGAGSASAAVAKSPTLSARSDETTSSYASAESIGELSVIDFRDNR